MSVNSVESPYPIFSDTDGKPLDDGYIYIGEPNQNPEVVSATAYWDHELTVPAAQPIRTIGGYPSRSGTAARIYTSNDYSITVRDKKSELVYSSLIDTNFINTNKFSDDFVGNISDFADLQEIDINYVTSVNIKELHDGITESGGNFIYYSTINKSTANPGNIIDTSVSLENQGSGVGFGCWIRQDDRVTFKQFGAKGDGSTDDTTSLVNTIAYCMQENKELSFTSGTYLMDGGSLNLVDAITIVGEGVDNSVILTTGTPATFTITRMDWQVSYDTGDYSTNIDTPISYAMRVDSRKTVLRDFSIKNKYEIADITFSTPFNAYTDLDITDYDYGLIVQKNSVYLENVIVTGFWKKSALLIDGSNVGGFGDSFWAKTCKFFGIFGVEIRGADGQPVSGDDFLDLTSSDTRCSSGISDISFIDCNIGDIGRDIRLIIDGNSRIVRTSATGGGLNIQGQLSFNTAKRIQGMRFINTRISAINPFVYKFNYANRVELYACHSEYLSGGFLEDGVTPVINSDCAIVSTKNAREIILIGGEKSGESNQLVRRNDTLQLQLVTKIGWDNSWREFDVPRLGDTGTFTPTLEGTSGAATYGVQQGHYARIGNLVTINARVDLATIDTLTGSLILGGLPFTCSANLGSNYNPPVSMPFYTKIITGDAGLGGILNDGTKNITIVKLKSGATIVILDASDLADGMRLDFTVSYITDET